MTLARHAAAPASLTRRNALSLMSLGALAAFTGNIVQSQVAERPWLWTPEQEQAEKMLLLLERDADVRAIMAQMRGRLAASPRGAIPDARATLDESIAQWTRSLIFAELVHRPDKPIFLWATDDTPREWLGHTLGGVGTSGDNPDAIYRMAGIEGGGRYEVTGQFHRDSRPVQFLLEVNAGDMAQPQNIMPVTAGKHADIHNTSLISDRELVVDADGNFRITLGGEKSAPSHLAIPETGYAMIGVRDILGTWTDRPARLAIRRLDPVAERPWTLETVRQRVLADLEGYIVFWSRFPDIWFGGIKPNAYAPPMGRPGGWGFVGGLNFSLRDGEMLLVTIDPG
ncbi:MAG: hypothetical protein N2423_08510, partial [Novosphingobium sp.]|nr:hypothetical protein [Novosphingobium sp.]